MTQTLSGSDIYGYRRSHSAETLSDNLVRYGAASSPAEWSVPGAPVSHAEPDGGLSLSLARIEGLGSNWDSYEAPPIEYALLDRVRDFIKNLARQSVVIHEIVPTSAGAIVLEWRRGNDSLVVEFDPDGDDLVDVNWKGHVLEFEGSIGSLTGDARILVEDALIGLASMTELS